MPGTIDKEMRWQFVMTPSGPVFEQVDAATAKEESDSYLPTLEEIAAECAAIQADWTPEETIRRRKGGAL